MAKPKQSRRKVATDTRTAIQREPVRRRLPMPPLGTPLMDVWRRDALSALLGCEQTTGCVRIDIVVAQSDGQSHASSLAIGDQVIGAIVDAGAVEHADAINIITVAWSARLEPGLVDVAIARTRDVQHITHTPCQARRHYPKPRTTNKEARHAAA